MNPIKEMWHVMFFIRGTWQGYYQFFHPNEAAARNEEKRLNEDPEIVSMGGTAKACRYVLAEPTLS